jgi:hypothetical protein
MHTRLSIWAVLCILFTAGTGYSEDAPLDEKTFAKWAPQLRLSGGMWDLPWQVSITEARRVAVKEEKPIFLIVNTGNCLGFV